MLFLGHHGDRDDAGTLARRLQRIGVRVWCSALDERGGGGTYHEEVIRAIKEADCFVALLGSAGLGGELTGEVSRALAQQGKRPEYRIVPVALPSARKTSDGLLENPPDVLEIYLPPVWLPTDWREQGDEFFRTLAARRLGQTLEPGPFVSPEAEARAVPDSGRAPEPDLVPERKPGASPTPEGPHLGGAIPFKRPGLRRWGLLSLAVVVAGLIVWLAAINWPSPHPKGEPERPLALSPDPSKADQLLQMVPISGGSFLMGDDDSSESDERPAHRVSVKAFELGAFEVTREQYRAVMKDVEGATIPEEEWKEEEERWKRADPDLPAAELERLAATHVSWLDAVRFCNALSAKEKLTPYYTIQGVSAQGSSTSNGYRLPSEAEWEYACRAGGADGEEYGFGSAVASLKDYGWYFVNSGVAELTLATAWDETMAKGEWGCRVHGVGRKEPSVWGLYDMHGNVVEWCEDTYQPSYVGAPSKGSAWVVDEASVDRVFRGGSFVMSAVRARSAGRSGTTRFRWGILGFRPAKSVTTD